MGSVISASTEVKSKLCCVMPGLSCCGQLQFGRALIGCVSDPKSIQEETQEQHCIANDLEPHSPQRLLQEYTYVISQTQSMPRSPQCNSNCVRSTMHIQALLHKLADQLRDRIIVLFLLLLLQCCRKSMCLLYQHNVQRPIQYVVENKR